MRRGPAKLCQRNFAFPRLGSYEAQRGWFDDMSIVLGRDAERRLLPLAATPYSYGSVYLVADAPESCGLRLARQQTTKRWS